MAKKSGEKGGTLLKRKKTKKPKNTDKQDKKEEVDMSKVINYGVIVIFTLFFIIGFTFIIELRFDIITNKLNVSVRGVKTILFLVLLVTYVTLVLYPVKKLFDKQVLLKKAPKGDLGIRGDRGKSGDMGACGECSANGLCYKKILYNITNTYNLWLKIKGRPLVPQNYVIKNEFLKDKIKKHCGSKEFKVIMDKYGSNKTNKDKDNRREGIYDYLNKLWSIWIMIILKYDKGEYFITSENISENHFMGLITENDSFQKEWIQSLYKNPTSDKCKVDEVMYIVNKSNYGFPYFETSENVTENFNATQMRLKNPEDSKTEHIKDILKKSKACYNNTWAIIDETYFVKPLLTSNLKGDIKTITKECGFNYTFIEENKGVPGRGLKTPFDEIKKYTAWYWGSDDFTNPEIKIITTEDEDTQNVKNLKLECGNYVKGVEGYFKKVPSNNFYKIWSSDYAKQETNVDNTLTPFKMYGTTNITILRCHHYINEQAKHPKFRTYKPLGDVIVSSKDVDTMPFESGKCFPNKLKYNRRILPRITDHNGTPYDENNIQTYLVAGDVKPPEYYNLVYSCNIDKGVNKKRTGLHIWKPHPPEGYIGMGYIFDKRYIEGLGKTVDFEESNTEPDKKFQPSTDLIYCVNKESVKGPVDTDGTLMWKVTKYMDGITLPTSINFTKGNFHLAVVNKNNDKKIPKYEFNIKECTDYIKNIKNEGASIEIPDIPSSMKDPKYSILKIYK